MYVYECLYVCLSDDSFRKPLRIGSSYIKVIMQVKQPKKSKIPIPAM